MEKEEVIIPRLNMFAGNQVKDSFHGKQSGWHQAFIQTRKFTQEQNFTLVESVVEPCFMFSPDKLK